MNPALPEMNKNNTRKGEVKITIKNLQKKIPISSSISERIKKAVLKTLSLKGTKLSGEMTVCFVNDEKIRQLNLKYSGKNNPTDVMVFDISESKEETLADIVISIDTAIRNAKIFRTHPLYEVYLYVVHGVLHILGYDDKNKKDRLIMHKKEKYICSKILNPSPKT